MPWLPRPTAAEVKLSKCENWLHVVVSALILAVALYALRIYSARLAIGLIFILDIYFVSILLEISLRKSPETSWVFQIPHRSWALLWLLLLASALVSGFATLYAQGKNVVRTQPSETFTCNFNETDEMTCHNAPASIPLEDRTTALYFSFVTMTTVGYGDYVPSDKTARVEVMWQLASSTLLLIILFPVLASRLALLGEGLKPASPG